MPPSVRPSTTLSPPKPLGGIYPNLLHDFPEWLGCARATLARSVEIWQWHAIDCTIYFFFFLFTPLHPPPPPLPRPASLPLPTHQKLDLTVHARFHKEIVSYLRIQFASDFKSCSQGKKEKYFKMSSAEIFNQPAKH